MKNEGYIKQKHMFKPGDLVIIDDLGLRYGGFHDDDHFEKGEIVKIDSIQDTWWRGIPGYKVVKLNSEKKMLIYETRLCSGIMLAEAKIKQEIGLCG